MSCEELKARLSGDTQIQTLLDAASSNGSSRVLEQLDENSDGTITFEEFKATLTAE